MLSIPIADGPQEFGQGFGDDPRISALSIEHDDLDSAIAALAGANTHDDLIIARLKKRKLRIRDEIASLVAAARPHGTPDATALPDAAESDAPPAVTETAPSPGSGSAVFGVFIVFLVLFMLMLGWSDMADSMNQTIAQLYLISLVAAANG